MKNKQLLSVLLALAMLLSLAPAAFAVTDAGTEAAAEAAETAETTEAEETAQQPADAEAAEEDTTEEAAEVEQPAEPEEPKAVVSVSEGETAFIDGDVAFNNGGIVYNNGGTVYNNGGTTYNNMGIVYNNGGIVYNNNGTVYDNGGDIFNNGGDIIESGKAGFSKIVFTDDYSKYTVTEGPAVDEKGVMWIEEEGTVVITPVEGYIIAEAEVKNADCEIDDNGICSIYGFTGTTEITLSICLAAPEFSTRTGTYSEKQSVKLTTTAGTAIYYTLDGTDPSAENGKKYTSTLSVADSCVIKAVAVAEGVGDSEIAAECYAFVKVTAPEFEELEEGYEAQPAAITVENAGVVNAVIESVTLNDKDGAFVLENTEGASVEAGTTDDTTWTIAPAAGLKAGKYSADVIITLDTGNEIKVTVKLVVKEAEKQPEPEAEEAAEEAAEEEQPEQAEAADTAAADTTAKT